MKRPFAVALLVASALCVMLGAIGSRKRLAAVGLLGLILACVLLAACGTTPRKHDAPIVETRTQLLEPPAHRLQPHPDPVRPTPFTNESWVPFVAAWREVCGLERQDKAAIIKWIEERKAEAAR